MKIPKTLTKSRLAGLIHIKFAKDVTVNLVAMGVVAVIGVLINTLVLKTYGVSSLGTFNVITAIYSIISLLAGVGVPQSVVKYASESNCSQKMFNRIVTSALVTVLAFSALTTLTLFLLSPIFVPFFTSMSGADSMMRAVSIGIPFFVANKVLMGALNARRRMLLYAFAYTFRWIIILFIISISIWRHLSIMHSIIAFPISEIVLLLLLSAPKARSFSLEFSRLTNNIRSHIIFGYKTLLANFVAELNGRVELLLIGSILSDYYVGIYSYASTIAKGVLMIGSVLQLNFNPVISNLYSRKQSEVLKQYIRKVKRVTILVTLMLSLLLAFVYPVLLFFVNGDNLITNLTVFYILLLGASLYQMYFVFGGILPMIGYPEDQLKNISISLIINIIANIILISKIGIIGSAISTIIFYMTMSYLLATSVKKRIAINISKL